MSSSSLMRSCLRRLPPTSSSLASPACFSSLASSVARRRSCVGELEGVRADADV